VLHIQTDAMLNPSHAALSESENMFGERYRFCAKEIFTCATPNQIGGIKLKNE
jgi:hypothetical protein